MLLEVSGFLVIFINYPNQKSFLLSTMDLYQNEEILTPCQEIENPDKRTICFYEMKIKQVRNHKFELEKTFFRRELNFLNSGRIKLGSNDEK